MNEEEDGKFAMATPPSPGVGGGGCMKRRRREKFTATLVGVRISSNEEEEGALQPPIGGSELTLAVQRYVYVKSMPNTIIRYLYISVLGG